jgi:hypothetical protein
VVDRESNKKGITMKKYLVVFVGLGLLSILFLMQFWTQGLTQRSMSESESWVSLLPNAALAESAPAVAQNAIAAEPKRTVPPVRTEPLNEAPQGISAVQQETPKLVPFVYYYSLPPRHYNPVVHYVLPAMPAVQPVQPVQPIVVAPQPVQQVPQPVLPIYYPQQVVPSRFGSPKLVYPNGVVIKPKVYFPRQPVRNSLRAVTP